MNNTEQKKETIFVKSLRGFEKHPYLYALIIITIILSFVVTISLTLYNERTKDAVAESYENVEKVIAEWDKKNDEDKQKEFDNAIKTTNKFLSKYKTGVFHNRVKFYRGELYFKQKKYDNALEDFIAVSKDNSFYLASKALFNQAVCYENLNKPDEAIKTYNSYLKSKNNYLAAEALFSIARIYEFSKDKENALKYFRQLEVEFPDSELKDTAKQRILFIENELVLPYEK